MPRSARIVVVAVVLVLLALRFVRLDADFPAGLTWSGELYTDEGWYNAAALNWFVHGSWYSVGDLNYAVNLPVFPLLQVPLFALFGPSLVTARLTVALFSSVLTALVYLLAKRLAGGATALVTTLVLAANVLHFAYSRLAITEVVMTTIMVLGLLLCADQAVTAGWRRIGLVGSVLVAAMLTKTTAICLFPSVIYLLWSRGGSRRRLLSCGLLVAVIVVLFALYRSLALRLYPLDYQYFNALAIMPRLPQNLKTLSRNMFLALWDGRRIDAIIYPVVLVFVPILLWRCKPFRQNRLTVMACLWIVAGLAMLGAGGYRPPRWYVMLTVPFSMLFAQVVVELSQPQRSRHGRLSVLLVLSLILGRNTFSIVHYLSSLEYSFRDMARDIRERVDPAIGPDSVLLTDGVATVGLATGIPSVTSSLGTQDLQWKLEHYQPRVLISLGDAGHMAGVQEGYDVQELAVYDVFGNYERGKRVHLFRLTPRRAGP